MNSEEIKEQSKKLKELSKKYGYSIKHGHALEIISQLNNRSNWHISYLDNPAYIKTGIKDLDKDLGGGLKRGTLTTMLGGTNVGKTRLGVSIVCNALRKKRKVLLYSLEGFGDEVKKMVLSNLSDIDFIKIMKNNLSEKEKNVIDRIKLNILDKYFIIKVIKNFDYGIENLTEDLFNERINFKFDLFVLDSGQLLETKDDYQTSMTKIHKKLTDFSAVYDCAVMTSAQTTQNSVQDKESIIRGVDVSESIKIVDSSTNLITINRNEEDLESERISLFLEKNGQTFIDGKCRA